MQQVLASHTSSKTTERYSHVRLRDLAGAVGKLPTMLADAPGGDRAAYAQLTFGADRRGGFGMAPDDKTPDAPSAGTNPNHFLGKWLGWRDGAIDGS